MSRRRPGSRHHANLDRRRWRAARKAALARAGHRSELSGLAGRLEVHHRVRLEDGGDPYDPSNLIVLTRAEHIELHRREHEVPGQAEWREFMCTLLRESASPQTIDTS